MNRPGWWRWIGLCYWVMLPAWSSSQADRSWWMPGEHLSEGDRKKLRELTETHPIRRMQILADGPDLPPSVQQLSVHYVRKGDQEALLLDGDLRWLVRDLGTFENVSASPHCGFNYGAFHFLHHGHLMSFGGSGYWTAHNQLVVFSDQTREYEWAAGSHPGMSRVHDQQVFDRGDELVCFQHMAPAGGGTDEVEIWLRNPIGSDWQFLGGYSMGNSAWTPGMPYFVLKEYVLFPNINRGLRVVRKLDFAYVDLAVHPLGLACQRGDIRPRQHGDGWSITDSCVYVIRDWEAADTLFRMTDLPVNAVWQVPQRTVLTPRLGTAVALPGVLCGWERWGLPLGLSVVGVGLGLGWLFRRRASGRSELPAPQVPQAPTSQGASPQPVLSVPSFTYWSPALIAVLSAEAAEWEVDAFGQLVGLGDIEHPETLRSHRARAFQQINEESQLVLGYPLLVRDKHPRDARAVVYRREPVPHFILEGVRAFSAGQPNPSER